MWVEKRGDKYLAVDRYKDYMTGKTKRVSVSMEKDTKQERNKAQLILSAKIEAARHADPIQKITLESLKDSYIAYQRKTLKESTVHRNEIILNIVINIIGSDALCDRLTASIIMDRLLSTHKANVTINTYLTRLKAMLRWGYQHDMCPDIAGKLKPLPDRSEREKISDKFLEKKDLKRLLDGMEVEQWRNLSRLLALSGPRIGEAVALTYDDIDVNARIIHVNKTFAPTTKTVTSPKTADSVRDVYMQDELLKLCRKLLTGAKLNALERGY
jgi:integrase